MPEHIFPHEKSHDPYSDFCLGLASQRVPEHWQGEQVQGTDAQRNANCPWTERKPVALPRKWYDILSAPGFHWSDLNLCGTKKNTNLLMGSAGATFNTAKYVNLGAYWHDAIRCRMQVATPCPSCMHCNHCFICKKKLVTGYYPHTDRHNRRLERDARLVPCHDCVTPFFLINSTINRPEIDNSSKNSGYIIYKYNMIWSPAADAAAQGDPYRYVCTGSMQCLRWPLTAYFRMQWPLADKSLTSFQTCHTQGQNKVGKHGMTWIGNNFASNPNVHEKDKGEGGY